MGGSPDGLRLHLGCGGVYLEGYRNIDLPPDQHGVQEGIQPDEFADIRLLEYPPGSVQEIRLHHVFEHFDRPTALRLLIDWYEWLEEGGRLVLETPDFEAGVKRFMKRRFRSERGTVVRHIFGSQEAAWAFHADAWYEEKFRQVLGTLGYEVIRVEKATWRGTDNITVTARKPAPPWPAREALIERAGEILAGGMVDDSPSEQRLHEKWLRALSGPTD